MACPFDFSRDPNAQTDDKKESWDLCTIDPVCALQTSVAYLPCSNPLSTTNGICASTSRIGRAVTSRRNETPNIICYSKKVLYTWSADFIFLLFYSPSPKRSRCRNTNFGRIWTHQHTWKRGGSPLPFNNNQLTKAENWPLTDSFFKSAQTPHKNTIFAKFLT